MVALRLCHLRRDAGLATTLAGAAFQQAAGGAVALPLKLTLCLTFRCHHRCTSCGIWRRDKGSEMTAAALDKLFSSVPDLRWLDLTGGEVVVRRDLPAIIASIHRRLPRLALLHFPTGAWLPDAVIDAATAMQVPGGPRVVVTVSIDGPPHLHDQLRGVSGAWDRALETLVRLRRAGIDAYPGMTLQAANVHAVDDTVTALASALASAGLEAPRFGHRDLHVNFLHTSPHYFANDAGNNAGNNTGNNTGNYARKDAQPAPAAELASAMAAFAAAKGLPGDPIEAIEWAYLRLVPEHLRTGRSPIACRSGELSAYIAPDGQVHACTIDDRAIGHLGDHGFRLDELWRHPRRAALLREIRADRCTGCWTPCEAYQTLLASPAATLRHGFGGARL